VSEKLLTFGKGMESDYIDDKVPGTSYVVDESHIGDNDPNLQKSGNIILHPQPSNDPNDPLNWTKLRKEYHYALVWIWAFILAVSVNWVGPVYSVMAETYNATLNQMNISSALCYLFLGVGCVLLQPLAMKYGRRPIYLFGTVLNIVGNTILGKLNTLGTLYTSNVLCGIAAAPVDSLVQISITDIFFLHEHGRRLSIYLFALYAGSYLGPIAAGYIYDGQGDWKWIAWWLVIISGGLIILQLFTMDETLYKRKTNTNTSLIQVEADFNNNGVDPAKSGSAVNQVESDNEEDTPPPPLKTYKQRMKLHSKEHGISFPLYRVFWMPFPTLRYPAVAWCAVVYGVQICWLSLLSITQAQFFEEPPYNFSAETAGLTNLASFIGGFIGMVYGSYSDRFQIWMTKRNKGIFEPEFRLWTLVLAGIINSGGLLMYGLGVHFEQHWMLPVMGVAFISVGISASGAIAMTYAVDCYPAQTGSTMVIILFIRNLLGTLFTFVFQYWLDGLGTEVTSIMLAVICFVANMSFLPFIKWGKTWRRYTANWYYSSIEKDSEF
jgi:MFS family permease